MSKFRPKYKWGGKELSSHLYHLWEKISEDNAERDKGLQSDILAALNGTGYIPGIHPLSPWPEDGTGDVL